MFTIQEANERLKDVPQRVVDYALDVVKREGGFVDNPNDPGGATNYGISLHYARDHGLLLDLNHDGVVDVQDIKTLTPGIAVICFLMDFFLEPHFDLLPEALQPEALDFAVNAGTYHPSVALQQTVNHVRTATDALASQVPVLAEDGKIGPATAKAAKTCVQVLGEPRVVNAYTDLREGYYRDIVREKPSLQEFLTGWINRAEQFREAA